MIDITALEAIEFPPLGALRVAEDGRSATRMSGTGPSATSSASGPTNGSAPASFAM